MSGRPIDAVLSRLDRVRSCGSDRWVARCPAHEDRSPSLSIKETSDGTVLLKDFAGCSTRQVLAAIGLSLPHLFPRSPIRERAKVHAPTAPPRRTTHWFDVEPHSGDPLWRFFVARAVEERAWRCDVDAQLMRDFAAKNPGLALAIIDDAAKMLHGFAHAQSH